MVSVWPHNWQAVLEAAEAASGHAAGPDVVREAVAAVSQGGGGSGLEAAAGEGPSGQQQQQQQASSCTSGGSCGGEAEAGYCPNTHSGGKEGEAAAQGTCSSSSSSLLPSPPPEEGSCSAGADPDTNATTASNSSNSNSTGGAASSSPAAAAPSSSSSLPGPIGALTDRLRKLVAGAPDPADHLGNDKVRGGEAWGYASDGGRAEKGERELVVPRSHCSIGRTLHLSLLTQHFACLSGSLPQARQHGGLVRCQFGWTWLLNEK